MLSQEDNVILLNDFLERADKQVLIISQAANGQLSPYITFTSAVSKQNAVYFLKRNPQRLSKENIKDLLYGDMSHLPLEQLSSAVESVFITE